MTVPMLSERRSNLYGSLWMMASMLAFSFEDVLLKLASADLPVSDVMILFGGLGMGVFGVLSVLRRQTLLPPELRHPSFVLRFLFELFGRLFFTLSLVFTALGSTVAILQAAPLVVVGGAAVFFGERVSLARWCAIFCGLAGVLLILRPATSDFTALSVLAVLGMLGLALRDLATRAVPRSVPNAVLGFYSFASIVAAGLLYAAWGGVAPRLPDLNAVPVLAGAALSGALGYIALTEAMRTGDISVVTPFRYTRLICGVVFGLALFGEALDPVDILGALIIVASGSFVLLGAGSWKRRGIAPGKT